MTTTHPLITDTATALLNALQEYIATMHTTGSVTRLIHALDDAYAIHPDDYGDDYPLDPITLAILRSAWETAHAECNRAGLDPCEIVLSRDPDYVAMRNAECRKCEGGGTVAVEGGGSIACPDCEPERHASERAAACAYGVGICGSGVVTCPSCAAPRTA